ncbi:3574_t:CDS:2 [Funneliformis geosporum]|nr:3574_t:CDS:2 [Funneliformis geosporum]
MLSFHKIKQQQKSKALKALKIIHSHNILHNDIRKENILVNEKGDIYIIDFGMSIVTDKKKLFCQEESELSQSVTSVAVQLKHHSPVYETNDAVPEEQLSIDDLVSTGLSPSSSLENKHISSHSSSQETSPSPVVRKIPYNQKVEQVADGEGQDLAQLFSDAEDAEGKR